MGAPIFFLPAAVFFFTVPILPFGLAFFFLALPFVFSTVLFRFALRSLGFEFAPPLFYLASAFDWALVLHRRRGNPSRGGRRRGRRTRSLMSRNDFLGNIARLMQAESQREEEHNQRQYDECRTADTADGSEAGALP